MRGARGGPWLYVACWAWLAVGAPPSESLAAPASASLEAASRTVGLNFMAPLDFSDSQAYANVVRQARDVRMVDGEEFAPVDADGFPVVSDFRLGLGGVRSMHGTYRFLAKGTAREIRGGGDLERLSWKSDSRRGTVEGLFRVTSRGPANLMLTVVGARRPDGTPGLVDIRLMRPVSPGSVATHAPGELLNRGLKRVLSEVQVVRFMDFLATSGNQQATWAERPLPRWMTFSRHTGLDGRPQGGYGWQGIGGPLEHVVLIANETRRDAWICIPHRATDEYVRNVALLFAFGSDGVLPFTGPHGSRHDAAVNPRPAPHPAGKWRPGTTDWYPPLDPSLKLYVEYSNEVWNPDPPFGAGYRHNMEQAKAEVESGPSSLAYDLQGSGRSSGAKSLPAAERRLARRGVEISNLFRAVFGDAAMPAPGKAPELVRVRPILASQLDWPDRWLAEMLKYLHAYWNNGEGRFVGDPHPPGFYFYGAGGAAYYRPGDAFDADDLWRSGEMDPERFRASLQNEALRVIAMGLRRVAYEGGPDFPPDHPRATILAQAQEDPRMRLAVLEHHRVWSEMGGDLLVYFTAVGWPWTPGGLPAGMWGFAQDVTSPRATPKLQALRELGEAPRAAPTVGTGLPGRAPGARHAGTSTAWEAPAPGAVGPRRLEARVPSRAANEADRRWAGYAFRAGNAAARTVVLDLSRATGEVSVYVDGVLLGTRPAKNGRVEFVAGTVGAGMHGVIVQASSGGFDLETVGIE